MLGNGRCFVRRPPRWVRMSMWGPGGRCVGAGSARGAPLQHLLPSEVVAVQCVPRGAEDSACRGDGDVLHERCPWCARHDAETHATFVSCLWSGALLFFPRASSSERAFRGERPLALPRDEVRRPERPHGVQVEGRAFQRACAICVRTSTCMHDMRFAHKLRGTLPPAVCGRTRKGAVTDLLWGTARRDTSFPCKSLARVPARAQGAFVRRREDSQSDLCDCTRHGHVDQNGRMHDNAERGAERAAERVPERAAERVPEPVPRTCLLQRAPRSRDTLPGTCSGTCPGNVPRNVPTRASTFRIRLPLSRESARHENRTGTPTEKADNSRDRYPDGKIRHQNRTGNPTCARALEPGLTNGHVTRRGHMGRSTMSRVMKTISSYTIRITMVIIVTIMSIGSINSIMIIIVSYLCGSRPSALQIM